MISRRTKAWLVAIAFIAVIDFCAIWTYRTQFVAPKFNVVLHQAVGRVIAEETSRLLDKRGKIIIVAMEFAKVPEMRVQIDAFKEALQSIGGGISVKKTYKLQTEKQPKYGLCSGVSSRRYVCIVKQKTDTDAILSFIRAAHI